MGLMDRIKKWFEPCEHSWFYAGPGIRGSLLIPEWIFMCKKCRAKKWLPAGCFPDQESFEYYREKMADKFKPEWRFITDAADMQQKIRSGSYFEDDQDEEEHQD